MSGFHYIQRQIDASEKLFEMMRKDHKDRLHQTLVWADMNESLQKKLNERDKEITKLKKTLSAYETIHSPMQHTEDPDHG